MINARDLRIGNLICYDPLYPIPKEIEGIINDKEIATDYRKLLTIDDIYPILLTREWLIKCGVVNNDTANWRGGLTNCLMIKGEKPFFGYTVREGNTYRFYYQNSTGEARYVHQLQNLYYCICGQELEIKP